MKKLLSSFIIIMMVLSLCACGKSEAVKSAESQITELSNSQLETLEDIEQQAAKIQTAENAVESLSDKEKGKVGNMNVIDEAYTNLANAFDEITTQLYSQGEAVKSEDIQRLKKVYDNLDDANKNRIKNTDYLTALVFDSEVRDLSKNISADSDSTFDRLQTTYNSMSAEQQELVTTSALFAGCIVNEIVKYKNEGLNEIKTLISNNKDLLRKYDRLEECLGWYGRWASFVEVENKLKSRLNDPESYHLEDGTVSVPFFDSKTGYYDVIVELIYTRANGLGGRIRQQLAPSLVYFKVNANDLTIEFKF